MKSKISRARASALGAFACLALLGTLPAMADTTYYYTGSPYTTINTSTICTLNSILVIPNPNAAADAAVFGTNLTGSITFGFDTTGVTATFGSNAPNPNPFPNPTVNQFTSGDISWGHLFLLSLTLTDGAITDWH